MPQKSTIEWTDYTTNPIRTPGGWGCTKVSPGCANCYAETINNRFGNKRRFIGDWNFFLSDKEIQELLVSKAISGKRVFVMDMGDLFHEDVPFDLIDRVFAVFALRPDVTWQVLTKRPERMAEYLNDNRLGVRIYNAVTKWFDHEGHVSLGEVDLWDRLHKLRGWRVEPKYESIDCLPLMRWILPLPNLWLGTSVEDQPRANVRIPHLLDCPAAVRFLSCEPILGVITFRQIPLGTLEVLGQHEKLVVFDALKVSPNSPNPIERSYGNGGIDWVIVGGESGPKARPCNVVWIRSVVKQCANAGVPCFVKQLGSKPISTESQVDLHGPACASRPPGEPWAIQYLDSKGGDQEEWPADLRVRQFPDVTKMVDAKMAREKTAGEKVGGEAS